VGRVLEQVQHRPIFVVDEVVGLEAPPAARERRRRPPPAGYHSSSAAEGEQGSAG
jgi:hypothetical protein